MDGSKACQAIAAVRRAPVIRAKPGALLPLSWAWALGLGWPAVIFLAAALEPAPADPTAATSAVGGLISFLLLGLLAGTALAASARHTSTPVWAGALGVAALGLTVACPASGHHAVGAWWFAQLALVGAMALLSFGALRSALRR